MRINNTFTTSITVRSTRRFITTTTTSTTTPSIYYSQQQQQPNSFKSFHHYHSLTTTSTQQQQYNKMARAQPQQPEQTKKRLVIVEGNISAGKSILSSQLAQKLNYQLILEPALDNPYLSKFYAQPKKYALAMQLYMLRLRYSHYIRSLRLLYSRHNSPMSDDSTCQQQELQSSNGVILDRSIFSDVVFAEQNYEDGNISKQGMEYYWKMRRQMMKDLPYPDLCLYLDVKPDVCLHRINRVRMRECESGIPLSYLQGLDRQYQRLLDHHLDLNNEHDNNNNSKNKNGDVVDKMRPSHSSLPRTIVRRVDWNDFGETDRIMKQMVLDFHQREQLLQESLSTSSSPLTHCGSHSDSSNEVVSQEFLQFLFNDYEVKSRLELPENPPEELYFDSE